MKSLNELCNEVEALDPITYDRIFQEKSIEVVSKLLKIKSSEEEVLQDLYIIILASTMADGKVTMEEYLPSQKLFKSFFGETITFEKINKYLKSMKKETNELKDLADKIVDGYGELDSGLKTDICFICLLICAVDGDISIKERKWLKKLLA